jgi:hypothetical protein
MEFRVDKKNVKIVSMKSKHSDLDYWMSVSWMERLSALESLRQQFYNYEDETAPRLQRIYSITQQTQH